MGGRKTSHLKFFFQLSPHYFSLPPLIEGTAHALYCPPVEAMHAVTVMSLKAIGQSTIISRHCVEQQAYSLFFSDFSRTTGVKPLKSGRAKIYSRPFASKSGGHSPSLPYSLFHPWEASDRGAIDRRAFGRTPYKLRSGSGCGRP